jgi:methylglutaconyl-CoA hydratase
MTDLIHYEVRRGVATLTLDSPPNRNALSVALIEQLLTALDDAERDDAVRVIVLSHTGRVFSSGADLTETAAALETGGVPVSRLGDVLAAIWESTKPVVARVGGAARAGGLGLIAAADIAICARDATFAFTEVRIGVIPAVISATVLPRLHARAAAEFYLTGESFDGDRAAEIGLVTAAVDSRELDATVAHYAAALVRGAPSALSGAKSLLRRDRPATLRDDIQILTEMSVAYFGSDDGREGMAAFREKRDPSWVPRT